MEKINLNFLKERWVLFIMGFLPSIAHASRSKDMLTRVLSGLIALLTSTPARLIFVISIIGVGYGTLALGKVPKEKAISVVVGIGIIFSASYIAKKMGLGV